MTTRRSALATAGLAASMLVASLCFPRDAFGALRFRADSQRGSNDVFEVHARAPWPNSLRRGWEPIYVELTNVDSDAHDFSITIEIDLYADRKATVNDRVRIEPGMRTMREVPIPVPLGAKVEIHVLAGRQSWRERLIAGTGVPDILATVGVFRNRGSTSALHVLSLLPIWVFPEHIDRALLPRKLASFTSLDLVVVDTNGELPDPEQQAALLAWVHLGGRLVFEGLTALDLASRLTVFEPYLEGSSHSEDPALASTFHCGFGRIAVLPTIDPTAEGASAQIESAGLAIFDLEVPTHDSGDAADPAAVFLMPGRLVSLAGEPSKRLAQNTRLHAIENSAPSSFVPRFVPQKFDRSELDRYDGPSRGVLVLLLVAFTIVIGPFSFFLARQRGTPLLAFALVPAFGIAGSGLVVFVSVASRGMDIRYAGNSWAYLDQRTHRVAVVEQRVLDALFSGEFELDPASGVCIPDFDAQFMREAWGRTSGGFVKYSRYASFPGYFVDVADRFAFSGGFLPARRVVRQLVLQEETTRARLDVRLEATAAGGSPVVVVTNALPVAIECLFVRANADEIHYLTRKDSRLDPGATARLAGGAIAVESVAKGRILPAFTRATVPGSREDKEIAFLSKQVLAVEARAVAPIESGYQQLAIGDFVAITSRRAFPLDGDLDVDAKDGDHLILGTLEAAALGEKK